MRSFMCWIVLLSSSIPVLAEDISTSITPAMVITANQLMDSAQRTNEAYAIVDSLTTEVGPRLAGTEAEARARQWAVEKMTSLGLKNIRVELFEVPLWLRGEESAKIVSPFPQPLTITALGGSASTGPQGVEAEVAVFESLAALEQSSQGAVQGKIVFIDEVMVRSRDGSGYGAAVLKRRQTAYTAQRLGAVAALIRSVGTSSHRFAHAGQMKRVGSAVEAGVPAAALTAADADQLVRSLAYAKPVVVKLVITPRLLPPAASGNVVGEIVGREKPHEIVLVGAHLDSWDLGTGAVDDGAGVGIVLGAAKLLIDTLPQFPRRTVRVVLFGSEEVGVVGARAYAQQHEATLANHVLAAESDFGSGDIWRFDSRVVEEKLPLMAAIAAVLKPLDIAPGNNTARGGPDLRFLREAGVPIASLLQDGQDYFDFHHTADDTLDKITPSALNQNVAAYAALIYLAAETTADFR
ncbi:MAG: M20/M25/M40 family metallo-hydrolase [Halioglobus sp.]|nr:M20/M25/M40 family metallo-hydrolase [Halioglobus sp.]